MEQVREVVHADLVVSSWIFVSEGIYIYTYIIIFVAFSHYYNSDENNLLYSKF